MLAQFYLEVVILWYDELFEELVSMGDSNRAVEMSRYMRNRFPFLGVPRPVRSSLYKKYYRNLEAPIDWDYVFLCFNKEEREYQYLAIDYLNQQRKYLNYEDIMKIHELIKMRSWWDSVDGFPRILGEMVKSDDMVKVVMMDWSIDPDIWVRRVSILHQLLFKKLTDTKLLEKIIVNNLGSSEFFINKAIGWILRDYSKTDKVWVCDFIERYRNRLDKLSIKEGSKYL